MYRLGTHAERLRHLTGHYRALEWSEQTQTYVENPELGVLVEVDVSTTSSSAAHAAQRHLLLDLARNSRQVITSCGHVGHRMAALPSPHTRLATTLFVFLRPTPPQAHGSVRHISGYTWTLSSVRPNPTSNTTGRTYPNCLQNCAT